MDWVVASPYFETAHDRWIDHAIDSDRHRFVKIPRLGEERNWHQSAASASPGEWLDRSRQARRAFGYPDSGVITVLPQLAAAAGAWKGARRDDRPLVAWFFNTEGLTTRFRSVSARLALRTVDRFVVHSTAERDAYPQLLSLPAERFEFVPFQCGAPVETDLPVGESEPYVFATGSGFRDYGTFFEAVAKLGYRTLVLASDRVLDGLTVPPNVEILDQLPKHEIRRLVRHARVNVVPMHDGGHTAGLVTIVETYVHGRSLVVTDRSGLDDYCFDGRNSLAAALHDPFSMAEAIDTMWSDHQLRAELDAGALAFAETHCTDAAAARSMLRILDEIER